jgi:hypothetical protein
LDHELVVRGYKPPSLSYSGTVLAPESISNLKSEIDALALELDSLTEKFAEVCSESSSLRETLDLENEQMLKTFEEVSSRVLTLKELKDKNQSLLTILQQVEKTSRLPIVNPPVGKLSISVRLPPCGDKLKDEFRKALLGYLQRFLTEYKLSQLVQFIDSVDESDFKDGIPRPLTLADREKLAKAYGSQSCGHLKLRAALIASWNRVSEVKVEGFDRKALKIKPSKPQASPATTPTQMLHMLGSLFGIGSEGQALLKDPSGTTGITAQQLLSASTGAAQYHAEREREWFDLGNSDGMNGRYFGYSLKWKGIPNITEAEHKQRVKSAPEGYNEGYYAHSNSYEVGSTSYAGPDQSVLIEEPTELSKEKPSIDSPQSVLCNTLGCSKLCLGPGNFCHDHTCTFESCPHERRLFSLFCVTHMEKTNKPKKSSSHVHKGTPGSGGSLVCNCGARYCPDCNKWLSLSKEGFTTHRRICSPSPEVPKGPPVPTNPLVDPRDQLIITLQQQIKDQTALIKQLSDRLDLLVKQPSPPEQTKPVQKNPVPSPKVKATRIPPPDPTVRTTEQPSRKGKGKARDESPVYQPTTCKVDDCNNWAKKGSNYCSLHILNRGVERPKGSNRRDVLPEESYKALRVHFGCRDPLPKDQRDALSSEEKKAYSKSVSVPRWAMRAVEMGGPPALERIQAGKLSEKDVRYNPGPVITRDGALDLWRLTRQKFKQIPLVANPQTAKERQFLNEFQRQRAMHNRAGIRGILPRLGRHLNGETWKQVNARLKAKRSASSGGESPEDTVAPSFSIEERVDKLTEALELLAQLIPKPK